MRLKAGCVAALLGFAAVAPAHAQTIKRAPAFAPTDLVAAPTTDWATNGGDLGNRRWSPLTAINRDNVGTLKGVWRTHLRGSGLGPQYSGEAQPLVYRGVIYVSTGANDVFAVSVDSGEILWDYRANLDPKNSAVCCGWTSRGVGLGDGKVFAGQLDGKLVALEQRTGKVLWSIQAERWQEGYTDHERAALLRRPRRRRLRGRRARHSRPREGVQREGRQARLDVLYDPGPGRGRSRHLAARQRDLAGRRRARLEHAGGRSRARSPVLRDRQSGPRLQRLDPQRRQPVLDVDRRGRGEDRANTAGTTSRCITTSGTTTRPRP